MENSGRESRKSFRFKKRAKPTHPTLEGKCYAETEIHHSLNRFVCLKLKLRNKFNRKKPKLKARTKAKHREPHLDQTMGHTCFARRVLRVRIRESFSRETRNLFYTPQKYTHFSFFKVFTNITNHQLKFENVLRKRRSHVNKFKQFEKRDMSESGKQRKQL